MKISAFKPKMLAVLGVSLFAFSCSVKGELQDLAEELEETNTNAKTEQVVETN